jgi:hypothetical protein
VSGLTFKNSGNYTNAVFACKNARFTNLTVNGGHNAVQYQDCENIYIGGCKFFTGDDCIAGAEGKNITVENCELNTSCNGFRLGGSDITIRNVHIYGPGKYEHKVQKRNNTLSGFTYFAPADWGGAPTCVNLSSEKPEKHRFTITFMNKTEKYMSKLVR